MATTGVGGMQSAIASAIAATIKPRNIGTATRIAFVLLCACGAPTMSSGGGGRAPLTYADRIVFSRYCCLPYSTFVIKPDGSELRPLLALPAVLSGASYSISPDGLRLAVGESGYQFDQIHIVDTIGGSDTRFPADLAHSYSDPSWSPDGLRIAFEEGTDATAAQFPDSTRHVLVANADGSGAIVVGDSALKWSGVAWSRDGQRIIYSRAGKLVEVNANGTSTQPRLIPNTDSAYTPALSPDGTTIVYARVSPDRWAAHLALVGVDGSAPTLLTSGPDHDGHPAFSPDGRRIVFERYLDPLTNNGHSSPILGLVDADGRNFARLYTGEVVEGQFAPTWGPAAH